MKQINSHRSLSKPFPSLLLTALMSSCSYANTMPEMNSVKDTTSLSSKIEGTKDIGHEQQYKARVMSQQSNYEELTDSIRELQQSSDALNIRINELIADLDIQKTRYEIATENLVRKINEENSVRKVIESKNIEQFNKMVGLSDMDNVRDIHLSDSQKFNKEEQQYVEEIKLWNVKLDFYISLMEFFFLFLCAISIIALALYNFTPFKKFLSKLKM